MSSVSGRPNASSSLQPNIEVAAAFQKTIRLARSAEMTASLIDSVTERSRRSSDDRTSDT